MERYERTKLEITEFEQDDVITTSAVQESRGVKIINPVYKDDHETGGNWLPWLTK